MTSIRSQSRSPKRSQMVMILGGMPLWWSLNGIWVNAVAQTIPSESVSLLSQVLPSIQLQQQMAVAAFGRQRMVQVPVSRSPVAPRTLPPETTVDPRWNQYQLGAGDTIFIQVEPPFQDLSFQSTLSPEGTIVVPLAGTLNLKDLSANEAAVVIREQLNRFVVEPIVSVTLLAQRPAQATITGAVLRPGFYPLPANTTPSGAILAAGGATLDANLQAVLVRRTLPDGTILQRQLDLYTPLRQGMAVPEFNLQDGDTIVVGKRKTDFNAEYDREFVETLTLTAPPQFPLEITVVGEVARPGFYPVSASPPPDVAQAILAAGGATLDANLRQVLVRRTLPDGTILERQLDLYTPLRQGMAVPEFNLQDGDTIIVGQRQTDFGPEYDREFVETLTLTAPPQFPLDITVVGEVARPGFYPVSASPPPDVAQAILAAGGTRVTANLREVLVRRTLLNGATVEKTIDLFTPLLEGTALPDFRLADGDVVVIPTLDITDREEYDRQLAARSTLAQQQIRVRLLSYASGGGGGSAGGAFNTLNLPNTSTLLDALQGVPLSQADLDSVAVIRFDEELGRAITQEFDAKAAMRGDPTQNVLLQDNDVIVVNRNTIAKVSYILNTVTQPFRDVLGFLLFFDRLQRSAENLFGP